MNARRYVGTTVAICMLARIGPASAGAVTITPTTTVDEFNSNVGACSLREAIESANTDSLANADGCTQGSGADVIELQPGSVYILSIPTATADGGLNLEGDLDIVTDDLDITVPAGRAVIDANGLAIGGHRALEIADLAPPITVNISNVTIRGGASTGDAGGGIAIKGSQAHVLNLTHSTISGNSSGVSGGGMTVGSAATVNMSNVTISGNSTEGNGGGLVNDGNTTLSNSTVTDNTADSDDDSSGHGGGLLADDDPITIENTIVAGNRDLNASGVAPDCAGGNIVGSSGFSLIGDTAGCTFIALGSGNQTNLDAKLGPLAHNGGPTQTHALLSGSPAINTGSTGGSNACETTDQRGLARLLGARCDKGAYELVTCSGLAVNRVGTGVANTLAGTSAADAFLLLGGNDVARGKGGGDRFCGGGGNDLLFGQAGKDVLLGQAGRDRLLGGAKRDRLIGGGGRDRLIGGGGEDRCNGGPGLDLTRSC